MTTDFKKGILNTNIFIPNTWLQTETMSSSTGVRDEVISSLMNCSSNSNNAFRFTLPFGVSGIPSIWKSMPEPYNVVIAS